MSESEVIDPPTVSNRSRNAPNGDATGVLQAAWPPLVFGVIFFGLWELFVLGFGISEFLLPRPSAILAAVFNNFSDLFDVTVNTGYIAVSGWLIGIAAGLAAAFSVAHFAFLDRSLTPLAVAANATPIIALAPIFNAWFGSTSTLSNQAVVVVIVFFPVFINTIKGLTEVEALQLELMRSLAASDFTVLRKVRIPNALPYFLTSLKLTAPLCVIAAIVAEYFGGPQDRIGNFITQTASLSRYDEAWSAIVMASILGLLLFGLAVAAERTWRTSS